MPVGAAIGAGSIGSALIGSSAANRAARAQENAANQARADFEPFRQAGLSALPAYQQMLGLDGSGTPYNQTALASLTNSPLYQFLNNQARSDVMFGQGRIGQLRSGNTGVALQDRGQQVAQAGALQPYMSSLQQLIGIGSGAASGTANAATQAGAAAASGIVGGANAVTGALGNFGNYLVQNQYQQQLLGALQRPTAYAGSIPTGAAASYGYTNPTGYSGVLPGGVGAYPY